MAVKLNSYVNFNGQAREAMDFYQSIFGGEVFADKFSKYESAMPVAPEDRDKIMHAYLKGDDGIEIMSSDAMSNMPVPESKSSNMSLTLSGDDEDILRGYWEKLSDGATITAPLTKSPWGDVFGMLVDKYGVNWMVDINPVLAA